MMRYTVWLSVLAATVLLGWAVWDKDLDAPRSVMSPPMAPATTLSAPSSLPGPFLPTETLPRLDCPEQTLIRVNVTGTVRTLRVAVHGAFRIISVADEGELSAGQRLPETTVSAKAGGLHMEGWEFAESAVRITAAGPPGIWVNGHCYRGDVVLHRVGSSRLMAVNHVPLQDYLASVVDSEMPADFPPAARQAQAIAARTYVLSQRKGHPQFDVYSTTRSQRYLGFQYPKDGRLLAGESAASRNTVRETAGLICTDAGTMFCTYYSAVCGGRTTPGAWVFRDASRLLEGVECRWCRDAELFRWTRRVSLGEATDRFRRHFAGDEGSFHRLESIKPLESVERAFPARFEVGDGVRRFIVSTVQLRGDIFPRLLPSPYFTIDRTGESLEFHGRGHGHGVGMCQWGARGMALEGRDCRQILAHYYPGCRVVAAAIDDPASAATPAPGDRHGIGPAGGVPPR